MVRFLRQGTKGLMRKMSISENQIVVYQPNETVRLDAECCIQNLIRTVRGVQVMLDRDLASLYGVEVKYLNRQAKRNVERFPADFMFQLTKEDCLRCQIGTINGKRGEHLKYMPYAFTENGIAMLSGVLRSSTAIDVNIRIMRAFTAMRRSLVGIVPLWSRIESVERRQLSDQVKNEALERRTGGNRLRGVRQTMRQFHEDDLRHLPRPVHNRRPEGDILDWRLP